MNIKYTGTVPTVADLTTVSGLIATAWDTNLKAQFPTTVTRKFIELTDLSSRTGATFTNTAGSAGSKTNTSPLPANVAVAVSWKINYRYRGGHPRTYHFGVLQGDLANSLSITGTYITALTNAYRAFFTAINAITMGGAPLRFAMLSYFTHDANGNQIYKPNPELFEISDCLVHSRLDSQRGRLGKETT